jgi:hypothetical protein
MRLGALQVASLRREQNRDDGIAYRKQSRAHTLRVSQQNGDDMQKLISFWSMALLATGCASYPAPTEHLASAVAAARAAQEVGVARVPQAQLHLKLAEDQIAQAKALMDDGNNERADYMTLRAYNDAALALALARENTARMTAEKAQPDANRKTP